MTASSWDEAAWIAAARHQQRLGRLVVERLKSTRNSIGDLANELGQTDDQLWRKLSGRARASLYDLSLWAGALGDGESLPLAIEPFSTTPVPWPLPKG